MEQDGCGEKRQQETEFEVGEDIAFEHAEVACSAAFVLDSVHGGDVLVGSKV